MDTDESFDWFEVPGFPTLSVRDDGQIYSRHQGKILAQTTKSSGHKSVTVAGEETVDGKRRQLAVHRLIAMARLPNPDNLPIVRHLDDVPANNAIENLAWGTYSDNAQDALRNGRNFHGSRDTCAKGHPYSDGQWVNRRPNHRHCLICEREQRRVNRIQKRLETPFENIPHGYGGYTNYGCRCVVCKMADQEHTKSRKASMKGSEHV